MTRVLQRAFLIVLGSALLGLLVNAVSPRGIPLIAPPKPPVKAADVITLDETRAAWESGMAIILDARTPSDYAAGHIPNAWNLPSEQFDTIFPNVAPMLTPDMLVVVYCNGEQCELSHEVQARLRGLGFKNVRVLINGWTVWQNAGLPGHTGDQP
jgi:rhodanese-related sulfurtransferase